MNFRSLNSTIQSITNSQLNLKEDYQTRERDRQMANTGQLGSALDSKEKASKKVYGKNGVVAHKSLRSMIKKANWKGLENEKNRLAQRFADPNKTSSFENRFENRSASVKEEQEYIEMLESALEAIAEALECSVEDLITESNKGGYFTDAKSRKAHVTNFYARKAKEKASRTPAQIAQDAKTDAYRADYTKRTGKRVGRID
jgi:hypothetical protein